MKFNIITSFCRNGGIGINGYTPWNNSLSYIKLFRKLTRGQGNNAVLMCSNTYDNRLNEIYKPFNGRQNLVLLENKNNYSDYNNVEYFTNIQDIISNCQRQNYQDVWIIGGEPMFNYFLIKQNNISIKNIYFNYINKDYNCNSFFPMKFNTNEDVTLINYTKINNVEQVLAKVNYNRIPSI